MNRLSKKTWDLILKLHVDQSLWGKLIGQQNFPLSVFDEIALEGEARAIPYLTAFLLNKQETVRETAARTIGQLVSTVKLTEFSQLDEACRNYWPYQSTPSEWPHLKPAKVKQLCHLPSAMAVMGITSFHGSGFVREAAVNELAKNRDGSELPFLLVRLNDWVEVVRESAATAILQRIRPDYARHFLNNLHLVFRLRSCGRNHHKTIVAKVTALLQEPGVAPILREGVLSKDRWLRRESFKLALAKTSEQGTALLGEMLTDTDPIMRLCAARTVFARLNEAESLPLLSKLVRDRLPTIRCEALNALAQRFPNEILEKSDIFLMDGSASVRAAMRFWIKVQKPEFDFAEFYRSSLNNPAPKKQRAAILGLSEIGTAADAKAVMPLLDAPAVTIKKAAIFALSKLDGDSHLEHFVAALTNQHPAISKEAARALARRTNAIIDQLYLFFKNPAPTHIRMNLFNLMLNLPFWSRGIFLFEALRDRDEQIIELARQALRSWLLISRNMAIPPTRSDVNELSNALKASSGILPPREVQEFEFLLRTYK